MAAALIGLGRMGLRHLQVLQELGLEVVGACDLRPEAHANAIKAGLAPYRAFTDPLALMKEIRPSVLVVSTTAPSHCDLVCAAAEHGTTAILCEKPMAVSLGQCDRMIDVCTANGVRLAVNHQMRFMEQYTQPKALCFAEDFGGLSSVTVVAGNFGMAMNGTHYFEMFRYLSDEPPAKVAAWFSSDPVPNPRGAQFEDRGGAVRIDTASGRRFYMEAGVDQGHGMFTVYAGLYGRIEVDELAGRARLVTRKPEYRALPTTRYGMPYHTTDFTIAPADAVAPTRAVMQALLAGEGYPDGAIGRMVVAVLVAAYVSHEHGGATVDLATADLPRERVFPWA